MANSALGLDLGDGVGIGSRLVELNVKGNISASIVSRRLEYLAFGILECKRELPLLEGAAFKHLLCLNGCGSRQAIVVDPNIVFLGIADNLRVFNDGLCLIDRRLVLDIGRLALDMIHVGPVTAYPSGAFDSTSW